MIDIGTVLNKLNDTVDEGTQAVKNYGLRFLKQNGETREVRCRKNVKSPRQGMKGKDPRGKELYNLKRNGLMLIQDIDIDEPRSIKVSMIYGFRDYQSSKWLNVFH